MSRKRMTGTWINPPMESEIGMPFEIRHPVDDPPLRIKFGRKWYDVKDLTPPCIPASAWEEINHA